jgi:hypothetical protein
LYHCRIGPDDFRAKSALASVALLGDHAHLDVADLGRGAVELAQAEEQQVGRHLRRGGEGDPGLAAAEVLVLAIGMLPMAIWPVGTVTWTS